MDDDSRCLFIWIFIWIRQINRPYSSALLGVKIVKSIEKHGKHLVVLSDSRRKGNLRRVQRRLDADLFRHLSIKRVRKFWRVSDLERFKRFREQTMSSRVLNQDTQDTVLWEFLCNRAIAFYGSLNDLPGSALMVNCSRTGLHSSRTGLNRMLEEKLAKINEARKAMETTKLAWCLLRIAWGLSRAICLTDCQTRECQTRGC